MSYHHFDPCWNCQDTTEDSMWSCRKCGAEFDDDDDWTKLEIWAVIGFVLVLCLAAFEAWKVKSLRSDLTTKAQGVDSLTVERDAYRNEDAVCVERERRMMGLDRSTYWINDIPSPDSTETRREIDSMKAIIQAGGNLSEVKK